MDELMEVLRDIGAEPTDNMKNKFYSYMDGILSWNDKINLTAIKDRKDFILKHFIDSLIPAKGEAFKNAETVMDVGTGGGFPGIPLALAFPNKRFILLDSLNKRLRVVNILCEEIGIHNVETVHGRAEDLANRREYRETFDLCVSRAVADLSVLCEYCLPFVRVGGSFFAYKGKDSEEEIKRASRAIDILGGKISGIIDNRKYRWDFDHKVVNIYKYKKTPEKFPRKAGIPSKKPLK